MRHKKYPNFFAQRILQLNPLLIVICGGIDRYLIEIEPLFYRV